MLLRWSPQASADFDAIFEFIAKDKESAAIRQARLILAATRQLERFPHSGRATKRRGAFRLAVPGTPYVLLYTLHEETVDLISIKHGAMLR